MAREAVEGQGYYLLGSSRSARRSIKGPSPALGADTSPRFCVCRAAEQFGGILLPVDATILRRSRGRAARAPAPCWANLDSMVVLWFCQLMAGVEFTDRPTLANKLTITEELAYFVCSNYRIYGPLITNRDKWQLADIIMQVSEPLLRSY